MADIAKSTPGGSNLDDGVLLTFTACVANTLTETSFEDGDVLVAWNSGGSGRQVTVHSHPDRQGRENDITDDAIGAGEHIMYGPFKKQGWKSETGKLQFQANHADVRFAIMRRSRP